MVISLLIWLVLLFGHLVFGLHGYFPLASSRGGPLVWYLWNLKIITSADFLREPFKLNEPQAMGACTPPYK